ncbi:helix-turn-helix domain-containing protein [Filimonas effusa]|uniref:AraC family transcriptional regulator n=1 Tax=Filimonas effusa TaxID=2508721 RepID=A0A4Q1D9K8_9BACT|nr:helix-turn-helix domain-containing protein [Filimonas effusa]RXK86072.1 AraC family transcriptional regulator [Filimonas effusa]
MDITGLHNGRITVPAAFEQVFSHFYYAVNSGPQTISKTLLPGFQTILVFSFGTPVTLLSGNAEIAMDKCMVLGPIKRAFDYLLPPGSDLLVANFKNDAFYRFFGEQVMSNIPIATDALSGDNCFTGLWQVLREIKMPEARVDAILKYAAPYLGQQHITASLLLQQDTYLNLVKTIARDTNQTERNVQLQQKKQFGYSLQEIIRYRRFLKAVNLVQDKLATGALKIDWFDIIVACDYYDQSQLVHDFKHFLNLTPGAFLRFQENICRPLP